MKDLTLKKAEQLHRELWGWLAETGESGKYNAPLIKEHTPMHECFACELCGGNCDKCPIDWGTEQINYIDDEWGFQCENKKSPYWKWFRTYSRYPKSRKKYAAIIRDLPWRRHRKGK